MSMDEFYGADKLFTLKEASNAAAMRGVVWEAMQPRLTPSADLVDMQVDVLRRRKQRCVLRYRVQYNDGGIGRTFPIIGKVYKADHGEPVQALMHELWQHGFDRNAPDAIMIPEVVAYRPRLSLLLQEEIGGQAVKAWLNTPREVPAVRMMARGLAKLHRSPVRVGKPFRMRDHLRRCHPSPQVLRDRCPELRSAVDEILDEATRLETAFASAPATLIHGDFHMAQVHVSETQTWLIDFDAACVADPAADLGNVLVFLRSKERKVPNAHLLADAFLDEYCRDMPSETLERVPLFEAITHLRRACKRLRMGGDGWERKARRFLDDSLASLAAVRR